MEGEVELSWNPRISVDEFTGDCKDDAVSPGQVHIRSDHTRVWARLGAALGNGLGGSFNKE